MPDEDEVDVIDDETILNVDPAAKDDPAADDDIKPDLLQELLEVQGFDSVEDLKDALSAGATLKELLGDRDPNKMIEDQDTLDSYKEHWKKQDATKKKEDEDPEDTIIRLEKEIADNNKTQTKKQAKAQETVDAQKAVKTFESTAQSVLDAETEDLSDAERNFVSQLVGIGNAANDIDITSKGAVKKMVKDGVKAFRKVQQNVIKNYRDGKTDVPTITPTDTPADTIDKPKHNIKQAGKAYLEKIRAQSK